MDDKKMRSLMIDHIDGKLSGELEKYVEIYLQKHPEIQRESVETRQVIEMIQTEQNLEVPSKGKDDFLKMVEREKNILAGSEERKLTYLISPKIFLRIAAAVALIVVGYIGGKWINKNTQSDILALKEELKQTKELVLLSMMKEESATERIKGVLASHEFEIADNRIIDALITTLNSDDNVNVRMAALDALNNFSEDNEVRLALIEALNTQENPSVQIKLIEILVSINDKRAIEPLQRVSENENNLNSVKDEAQMGIFKLL